MPVQFAPARRTKTYLKLALTGPSGSGKTYSALELAFGLVPGGRVAVLDTENGSAALYDQLGPFDHAVIDPPYLTEKYIDGLNAAVAGGYDVLIIDSISHEWSGEGGILRDKEARDLRGGNQYTNWAQPTKAHEAFLAAILHAPIHTIVTIRSKQGYVVGDDGKPHKVGMAPIQREGAEYEFTVVLDIDMGHMAQSSKDRSGLFAGTVLQKVTRDTGKKLRDWLDGAVEAPAPPAVEYTGPAWTSGDNGAAAPDKPQCETCGKPMTQGQVAVSRKKFEGKTLCPSCQKAEESEDK